MKNFRFAFLRRPLFWIFVVVVLLVVAGGAYLYSNQTSTRAQTTAVVTRGDLRATVNANARVRAEKSVRLAFPYSGLVKAAHVREGDAVEQGALLLELDDSDSQRALQKAQLNLDARQQDLSEAQQPLNAPDLEIAQQSLKKAALALAAAENRYEDEATDSNRIARELAQSDYDIARANFERQTRGATPKQLADLERALESARLDVQAAQEVIARTKIVAPFAGVVTLVNARVGELFGGFNAVVELADLNTLQLVAEIDEIDVAEVRVGQNAEFRFDAFPGASAQGTVTRLFPAATSDRGATVYQAILSLEPTVLKLRPGMGATASIATVEKKNVLRVPTRAIKSAGAQKFVLVQDGATTRNVIVETGVSDASFTEIVSGVSEGTTIIIE